MPKVTFISKTGSLKKADLKEDFLNVHAHEGLIYESVRRFLSSIRQGSHDTKTRSEVRGGGRKPFRQKGTGRARAGTIRSPLWKGGGVVFGPHSRDYSFDIPKKQKKRALAASLTFKAEAGELYVIETEGFAKPKTKEALAIIEKTELAGKKLTLAFMKEEEAAAKSFRNIERVQVVEGESLNPYHVLNNECFIVSKNTLERIKGVFAKNV